MFKETTRKKLDSGISIFLSLYIYPSLSYLTMGVETKGVGIKGGKKKNWDSSKIQLQPMLYNSLWEVQNFVCFLIELSFIFNYIDCVF